MQELLDSLIAQQQALLNEGDALFNCWVSSSIPSGTASAGAKPHYQLRSRLPQFGGKKSRYVKADDVAAVEAAIDRGRQIAKLEKQIDRIAKRLDRTAG